MTLWSLMRGSLPSARLLNGCPLPSPSRIPHLTFHILSRRSPSSPRKDSKLGLFGSFRPRRFEHSSSTSVPPSLREPIKQSFVPDEHDGPPLSAPQAEETSVADATQRANKLTSMHELLGEKNPERILLGLVSPQIGDDFIKDADDEAFASAISAIDPEHFVIPFRNMFRYLKPSLETQPKYRIVRSTEERVASFIYILDTVITQRHNCGHPLGLDIYRHLLRCAAATGNGSFARNIFTNVMPEEGVEPDLDCYNHYMEALAWNEAYSRHERYRLRVVRYHMMRRSDEFRPLGFVGHGVASLNNTQGEKSIRLEILALFHELVDQGMNGNEATFCNLMVAMGREGDLGSVKSVLKSVWNLDVDALDRCDEKELESPMFHQEGSPLRPSTRLLFTVVHVFGTNNKVALGGMLLDYISRTYNLRIPEYVWTHLLEWTFVLSIQHSKSRMEQGFGEGRIARRAVESVYHVFHSEPYNVKPKIPDLIFRVKASQEGRKLYKTLDLLRECMVLLQEERNRVSEMHDQLRQMMIRRDYHDIFHDGLPSTEFLEAKRRFVNMSMQMDCDIQLISIAVRNTFKRKDWICTDAGTDWPYRGIPDMIAEWAAWLPNTVSYYTPTGHVRIWAKYMRRAAMLSSNSSQTTKTGVMRRLLDTYSPSRLCHAIGYYHRTASGPKDTFMPKYQAELDNDTTGKLTDWVHRYEESVREGHLNDRQVATGMLTVPGPDRLGHDWKPWGGMHDKNALNQDHGWWEMGDTEDEGKDVKR